MDFNGYKRTKKFDIKRWFKGTNSIVYLVILVVCVVMIMLKHVSCLCIYYDGWNLNVHVFPPHPMLQRDIYMVIYG